MRRILALACGLTLAALGAYADNNTFTKFLVGLVIGNLKAQKAAFDREEFCTANAGHVACP